MTGMVEVVGLRLILDSLRELGLFSFFGILLILNLPSILYSTIKIFRFQADTTKNLDTINLKLKTEYINQDNFNKFVDPIKKDIQNEISCVVKELKNVKTSIDNINSLLQEQREVILRNDEKIKYLNGKTS
jgi:hypothetical protein